ncbi:aspartyl-phosphate phosphatase Spo0E family protein, partial [Paenibacillus odorifer]|uniref:aspartyl-phosphate phosphatase Spo0E family protein n=1 Tax=Paenibacillus odorifer TaxID=189426 RepID=UPI001C4D0305
DGQLLTIDLRSNRLTWSRCVGDHEIEYKTEPVRNGFVRIISGKHTPCITKHQVRSSTNDVLLHHIFRLSDMEQDLLLRNLKSVKNELTKISNDIEDLRGTLCQTAIHTQLLRPEVLAASEELDRKIIAFMHIQKIVVRQEREN